MSRAWDSWPCVSRHECDAAESRIAAALACHKRSRFPHHCAECSHPWDIEADRCTSPTVTALLGLGA